MNILRVIHSNDYPLQNDFLDVIQDLTEDGAVDFNMQRISGRVEYQFAIRLDELSPADKGILAANLDAQYADCMPMHPVPTVMPTC